MQISRSFTHTFSHTRTRTHQLPEPIRQTFLGAILYSWSFQAVWRSCFVLHSTHSWSFAAERIYSPCTGCQIDPLNHPFRLQKHSQYIIHQHQSITKTSAVLPDQVESSPFAQSCSCHLITHLSDLNVLLLSPRFCNPNLLSQRNGFP